tara:strand:+ start:632 stop:946 length:315 start_codon:yes stop_codon:yes gene_type:complete
MSTLINEDIMMANFAWGVLPSLFICLSDKNRTEKGNNPYDYDLRKSDDICVLNWVVLSAICFISSLLFLFVFGIIFGAGELIHILSIVCQTCLLIHVYKNHLPL